MSAYRSFGVTLTSLALLLQTTLSARAAGVAFAPATKDDIAQRSHALAAQQPGLQYSGPVLAPRHRIRSNLADAAVGRNEPTTFGDWTIDPCSRS